MAENIKNQDIERYFEILDELFFRKKSLKTGKMEKSALEKYAEVRHTQYEMDFYLKKGYRLYEVKPSARRYFRERFLPEGVTIEGATPDQIREASERLKGAVENGCPGRCTRLVEEMNDILERNGLQKLNNVKSFLDYFTFDKEQALNEWGEPAFEPGRYDPIYIFHCKENREEFKEKIREYKKKKLMLSMVAIGKIIVQERSGIRGN